jgi:hypothetical protein
LRIITVFFSGRMPCGASINRIGMGGSPFLSAIEIRSCGSLGYVLAVLLGTLRGGEGIPPPRRFAVADGKPPRSSEFIVAGQTEIKYKTRSGLSSWLRAAQSHSVPMSTITG